MGCQIPLTSWLWLPEWGLSWGLRDSMLTGEEEEVPLPNQMPQVWGSMTEERQRPPKYLHPHPASTAMTDFQPYDWVSDKEESQHDLSTTWGRSFTLPSQDLPWPSTSTGAMWSLVCSLSENQTPHLASHGPLVGPAHHQICVREDLWHSPWRWHLNSELTNIGHFC